MLDLGATFDGYFCDFDRNFSIEQSDDLSHQTYDILWRATEAGMTAARPGTTCRELFHSMQSVIAEIDVLFHVLHLWLFLQINLDSDIN